MIKDYIYDLGSFEQQEAKDAISNSSAFRYFALCCFFLTFGWLLAGFPILATVCFLASLGFIAISFFKSNNAAEKLIASDQDKIDRGIKMIVSVDKLKELIAIRRQINSIPLEQIEWQENGAKVNIDPKLLDEWQITGLNNVDFIDTNFYKGEKINEESLSLDDVD